MPYKSRAQEAFMHIHHPEIAKKWDAEHVTPHDLPQHVSVVKTALRQLKQSRSRDAGAKRKD